MADFSILTPLPFHFGKRHNNVAQSKKLLRLLLLLPIFFIASSFNGHNPGKPAGSKKSAGPGRFFDGGDFSLDFAAAGPGTYIHDGSMSTQPFFADKVESLEGGDFKCGDVVTYFTKVSVNAGATGTQTIELNYSFLADATGQSGVGHDDIVSVGVNTGDPGMADGGTTSTATLSNETLTNLFNKGTLTGTVTVDGLEANDVIIVYVNVHLACDPGKMPTGNLQGAITSAQVISPANSTIMVGNQTVPFKQVGQIVLAGCALPDAGPYCTGTTNSHTATAQVAGATYTWDLVGNATFDDGTKMKTTTAGASELTSSVDVVAGAAGSYTLSVIISKEGAQSQECGVDVTVNAKTDPTFDPIDAICSGGTFTLPATSKEGITGSWSPDISTTATTEYTFTPDAGQCANGAKLTVTVNAKTDPTFDPISAICNGDVITLPTTSKEGITGSWSPAPDNTTTTEYTFTPDAGQCANEAKLTVTVNQKTTPTFNAIAALCQNSPAPALPTTSTNGIKGTWNPSTISTATTGTTIYTFTPNAGQCANGTTLNVTVNSCVTTFTQGFWGGTTANGKDCGGRTVNTILTGLLSSSPFVGVSGKSLTLNDVKKLIALMPGGGYVKNVFDNAYTLNPYTLPAGYLDSKSKKLNSVVISQTIALKLNVLYNQALGTVAFVNGKNILNTSVLTYTGTTSCTVKSVSSTTTAFTMSPKVLCYLFANAYTKDINGLLQLANDVIGGVPAFSNVSKGTPFSYSDLVQTLDAINRGFDRGAMLKSYSGSYAPCGVLPVTLRSTNSGAVNEVPTTLAVSAYPNPYSNNVRFTVANPKAGQGSLEVFNMLGQKVKIVYQGYVPAGTQRYDLNMSGMPHANLIYRLSVSGQQVSGKLLHASE